MQIGEATTLTRDHAVERLADWRRRVHELYDEIEHELRDTELRIDRSQKLQNLEELGQRAGLRREDVPEMDILRIVRSDGREAARLVPKGLWVIGANGRVDLRIAHPTGGTQLYLLFDQSEPLAGPAQWIRAPVAALFEREPFTPSWLKARLL